MTEPIEEPTMTPSESVKIYDNKGKKICSIQCPQDLKDVILPSNIEFNGFFLVTEHKHRIWKNPESTISWAWTQAVFAASDLKEGKIPTTCIVCFQKSIITINYVLGHIVQKFISKKQPDGIMCKNPDCPMYKVVIPSKIFTVKSEDFPPVILAKFKPFLR